MDRIEKTALIISWSYLRELKEEIENTLDNVKYLRHSNLIIPMEDIETTINTIEKICTIPYLYKVNKHDIYS